MPRLTDKNEIRTLLRRDPAWSVYALGDLEPSMFPKTRWFAPDLTLIVEDFGTAILFAMGTGSIREALGCVTGAVLAIRRELFERLNGFDESLRDSLQDVDLCLRAQDGDDEIVFNPRAVLVHAESASIAEGLGDAATLARRTEQHAAFLRRWGARIAHDPFHNANFESSDETLSTLRRSA